MTHVNPGVHEGVLKSEAAPEQETHEVVAPKGCDIVDFVGENTVAIDAIPGNIGTNVCTRGEVSRLWITDVQDL